jgi:UDP-glucose:(heptosyl)LPS alpha-1,3-glucosyltransferase
MKIGLVRRGYSPSGGAENYLRRLAAGLAAAGHECVLFASPEWPAAELLPGGEFCSVPGRTPGAFADRLAALQPERRCDVLFSLERVWRCDCYRAGDGVHRAWLERRARSEPGWRSVWRQWNPKHRQLLDLEATLFGPDGARKVIANSKLVAAEIARVYGCTPERISVVYNGLPASSFRMSEAGFRQRARAAFELAEGDYAVLFAGSGWERKGLDLALSAIARLPDRLRPVLLVAGRGDVNLYRRKLPAQARAAGRVRFLGEVGDMAPCYAAADIFVLPTLYDPFSNACLEALAAGLPVITTAENGFAEIMETGQDGEVLSVDGDAAEALTAALAKWSAPDLRTASRSGRRANAAGFTIERNVAQTLEIITRDACKL